jgi:uncharacterized membrane protein YidH (DUF202 family)
MIDRIVQYIIDPIIILLVAVSVVVFVWGIIEFVSGAESSDRREAGKSHLIWGIVGLTIIVSTFAIIRVLQSTLITILQG